MTHDYQITLSIGGGTLFYTGCTTMGESAKWTSDALKAYTFSDKAEADKRAAELQHGRDTEERYYLNGERIMWDRRTNPNGLVGVSETLPSRWRH